MADWCAGKKSYTWGVEPQAQKKQITWLATTPAVQQVPALKGIYDYTYEFQHIHFPERQPLPTSSIYKKKTYEKTYVNRKGGLPRSKIWSHQYPPWTCYSHL